MEEEKKIDYLKKLKEAYTKDLISMEVFLYYEDKFTNLEEEMSKKVERMFLNNVYNIVEHKKMINNNFYPENQRFDGYSNEKFLNADNKYILKFPDLKNEQKFKSNEKFMLDSIYTKLYNIISQEKKYQKLTLSLNDAIKQDGFLFINGSKKNKNKDTEDFDKTLVDIIVFTESNKNGTYSLVSKNTQNDFKFKSSIELKKDQVIDNTIVKNFIYETRKSINDKIVTNPLRGLELSFAQITKVIDPNNKTHFNKTICDFIEKNHDSKNDRNSYMSIITKNEEIDISKVFYNYYNNLFYTQLKETSFIPEIKEISDKIKVLWENITDMNFKIKLNTDLNNSFKIIENPNQKLLSKIEKNKNEIEEFKNKKVEFEKEVEILKEELQNVNDKLKLIDR